MTERHPTDPRADPVRGNGGGVGPPSPAARVLVVEDDADSRRLLQRLLRMWGYDALAAEDGPRAVDAVVTHRPAVALVDLGLPGVMDGYEVARRVRAAVGQAVRLVALTGFGEPEDRDKTAAAGFDLHMVKPVHPERLSKCLADLIAPTEWEGRGADHTPHPGSGRSSSGQ